MDSPGKPIFELDAVIVGGGIAGLWALNQLVQAGYNAVLLEATQLGAAQTLASQGMIHGGLKYALAGTLNRASDAIAAMPGRWREALKGIGPVDLTGLKSASDDYYLYASSSALGRLTGFFASRALRGRIDRVRSADYPEVLRHEQFKGVVYRLNDFVVDVPLLLNRLSAPLIDRIGHFEVAPANLSMRANQARIDLGHCVLNTNHLILCAGCGNERLIEHLGLPVASQRRALHQVVVRHAQLKAFYAHCIVGSTQAEPRITFTSVETAQGWVWYLGGQIATSGVDRSVDEQVAFARRELFQCVPWIDWNHAEITTFRIDRSEPKQQGLLKPDEAFATRSGPVLVAWPTKLTLAPDLGDRVLTLMDAPQAPPDLPTLCPPEIGRYPWLP
ncbi:MAG: FAD-dependent oxidoreductase [Proteobacteria bacterium]|nr:FAD-dependent oxidoreductase [Pseudomonadota bacterium]